jgi:biopolymer transport protein ExbD
MHLHQKGAKTADLNLVPYIDLLTCMVAFLLITAVWTQLARLQVRQGDGGETSWVGHIWTPLVLVTDEGFHVTDKDSANPWSRLVPRGARGYDFAALGAALKELKAAHPDAEQLQVSSEARIPFETLVSTMDTAISAGFPALSLVDTGASGATGHL